MADTVSGLERSADVFFCITDSVILMTDTVSRLDRSADVFFSITDSVILMTDTVFRLDRRYGRRRYSDDRHRFSAR